jgi:hypothetical protein
MQLYKAKTGIFHAMTKFWFGAIAAAIFGLRYRESTVSDRSDP